MAKKINTDAWKNVREARTNRLMESDWSMIEDNQLTETEKLAWKTYRQQLRDLPQTFDKPENVVFPEQP
jgi:hypothetical protein